MTNETTALELIERLREMEQQATSGKWKADRTLYLAYDSSPPAKDQYQANKKFACALVNAFRAGELVSADALAAAQARIAELEGALKLAEHDISYAFDRLGIPKEKSSVLPVIRAALEGKG